ncbi:MULTISPECIES: dCTP deaminase domain-containing protein [unclassified Candidatus Frackibacter]|uniref:dCTP deaminase domain-containing protein n=1 Tax=unclassified Candidatus Frackibacter TaxID=2648818 RepID=UPI00087F2598|nr:MULTISPECIES: hypothetical protein [unclassified Candidatus Frackibacter]SDC45454.1 dUTPase [Candidatus Frackibacter sp. WG11]SEM65260.1 dUTPase [Candidatus Frackibacter sp. WG12]SFL67152.1 dUTPase [Candidatus Frackibacter sp. WG13]
MNNKESGVISGKTFIKRIIGEGKEAPLITCEEWGYCDGKDKKYKQETCNPNCYKGIKSDNFKGWQIDLNLGKEAYITGSKKPIMLKKEEYLTIEPGDFALLETEEIINLPSDLMGFISVRFKYKKMGLVNISGFHVDPGYKGKLIFSVYNAGPDDIIMQQGKPVFMIFFLTLTDNLKQLDNDVKDEGSWMPDGLREILNDKDKDEIFSKRKGYKNIPIEFISMIQGSSVSLSKNNDRIDNLESKLKMYGSILVGIIIALFGTLMSQIFQQGG